MMFWSRKTLIPVVLSSVFPITLMQVSCSQAQQHEHVKGNLLNLVTSGSSPIRPGVFQCLNGDHSFVDTILPEDVSMPIINIDGSINLESKDDSNIVSISYLTPQHVIDFTADAKIKLQGESSLKYPKKNYNIQLYYSGTQEKMNVTLFDSWPQLSKYTLKANYIDAMYVHNAVVSCLYGDVIHQRGKKYENDKIFSLLNGGAIDAKPILIYNNSEFLGFYTINIPKEKELFNMSSDEIKREAMLFADDFTDSTLLKQKITSFEDDGWDVEHCSTGKQTDWIKTSFNNLIDFVNESTDSQFILHIDEYIDLDRTIDYLNFVNVGCMGDNSVHNILWVTYDGVRWTPSAYDLDATFGLMPDGDNIPLFDYWVRSEVCPLFNRIYQNFWDKICLQYKELRSNSLSNDNIIQRFTNAINSIDSIIINGDRLKWPEIPSKDKNTLQNLIQFTLARNDWLDSIFK